MVQKKVWRLAADSSGSRLASRDTSGLAAEETATSLHIAREDIVREMMRIFDGLLGGAPKRRGVNLGTVPAQQQKQRSVSQRKLEMGIYRLLKGLIEQRSPDTGFAIEVLFNNASYFYNKAAVPPAFGVFIKSMVEFLEGHNCHLNCPEEMNKLRTLLDKV